MKKVIALVLALCMVLTIGAAFAAVAPDASVSVSGLMAGDSVAYYQVLEWDQSVGWKLAEGFTGLDGNTAFGSDTVADIVDGITQEQANVIASYAAGATAKFTDANITGVSSSYTIPADDASTTDVNEQMAAMGLYMAIITAGTPEYVYNPVFVGADFEDTNDTNSFSAEGQYGTDGVAKKQHIVVEKTTEDANSQKATAIDSKVGEEVTFHVATTIPVFLQSYTQPSFVIDDHIETTGIKLVKDSIKVKVGDTQYAEGEYSVTDVFTVVENGTTGYTVTFDEDFLKANVSAVDIMIDYKGEITNTAEFNANEDDNTVTVTYSNGPTNEKAALRDRTNHYTFSIGAKAFGETNDGGKTYEVVKVGVDADGKPVTEKKEISSWETIERHPLDGAEFGLWDNETCTGDPIDTFTTGGDGIITFKGLDQGTYYIQEINSPMGYIKDNRIVSVKIEAVYTTVDVDPDVDDNGIKVAGYSFDVLDHYTVTVNNVSVYDEDHNLYGATQANIVNTYVFDNDGKSINAIKDEGTIVRDSEMINTKGAELPSTGGIGTTIFYILGGLLVVGAVVILVARRKAQD